MSEILNFINSKRTEEKKITQEDLNDYLTGHDSDLQSALVSLSGLTEDEFLVLYADITKQQLIDYSNSAEFINELDVNEAYQLDINWSYLELFSWYPLSVKDGKLILATNKPMSMEARNYLQHSQQNYEIYLASESLLQRIMSVVEQTQQLETSGLMEVERLRALASEAPVINLVNSLMYRSLDAGASDMHVEPMEGGGRVRIRIDGILQKLDDIPNSLVMPVISRIKILADMDIAEKRRPQDGKIALHHRNIDVRASILPLNNGESVVLRFLAKGSLKFEMAELGFEPDTIERIDADLKRTAGVILMTGPTGSGKTTTLYSFLQQLNSSHEKIITLEDPVEYELEGVNQIQINTEIGFNFAAGLRSIVRQDPDVIMVGEIRDAETARIAMQSSLTGHLVFSTVHTNDTPGAYVRLIDLGVDEFLLNAAVISIIAQRLVRKLCSHCAVEDTSQQSAIEKFNLHDVCSVNNLDSLRLMKSVGCEKCSFTGFSGRLALIEYLPNNDDVKGMNKDSQFTLKAEKYMKQQGFRNLFDDGLVKVVKGQTTIEEVVRVAG